MAKYKIHKKEELSEEEIQRFKDFETVKKNYKRTVEPLYKFRLTDKKNMQRLFLLLLILWLVYMATTADEEGQSKDLPQQAPIENME